MLKTMDLRPAFPHVKTSVKPITYLERDFSGVASMSRLISDQICEGSAGVNELRRPIHAQSITGRQFNRFRQQASSPVDPFPLRGTGATHDRVFPNRTVFGRQCAPWVAVLAKWEEVVIGNYL